MDIPLAVCIFHDKARVNQGKKTRDAMPCVPLHIAVELTLLSIEVLRKAIGCVHKLHGYCTSTGAIERFLTPVGEKQFGIMDHDNV